MDSQSITHLDQPVMDSEPSSPVITVTRIGDTIRTSWDKEIDPYTIPALLRHAATQIEKTVLGI